MGNLGEPGDGFGDGGFGGSGFGGDGFGGILGFLGPTTPPGPPVAPDLSDSDPSGFEPPETSLTGITLQNGAGGNTSGGKARELQKAALGQKNLSKCLNKFFGPGTILTNANLPSINATENLTNGAVGQTRASEVPDTGRGSVYIDQGVFTSLPATDPFLIGTYLHETANVLAIQIFTQYTKATRAYAGPRGGPPTAAQNAEPFDHDIGQQFEKCIFP